MVEGRTALSVRPMRVADAEATAEIMRAALEDLAETGPSETTPLQRFARLLAGEPTPEWRERFLRAMRRFPELDPSGSWIGEREGCTAGVATALRRGSFWGLSMFFVHPDHQGQGLGELLLERAIAYAADAKLAMIVSSDDAGALRRYVLAGFALNPTFKAAGVVQREVLPGLLPVREGSHDDLELIDRVDLGLRESSRALDVEFMLREGGFLRIADGPGLGGYAVHFGGAPLPDGNQLLLGAEDETTAQALLWDFFGLVEGAVEIYGLTSAQSWAFQVATEAKLRLAPDAAVFVRGVAQPPAFWIPSGFYF